jgi:sulfatase modifying factor 1
VRRPVALLLRLLLPVWAGCSTQGERRERDAGIGTIVPPDSGGPHCIDPIPLPDAGTACRFDDDCKEALAPVPSCQRAVCRLPVGLCELEPLDDAAPCDDLNPCTIDEACFHGICSGGRLVCECSEDDDCLPYEDGDLCNGALFCDQAPEPSVCTVAPDSIVSCQQPQNPCWTSTCTPKTGACVETERPAGAPCDDGDPCTIGDACLAGTCRAGLQNLCACPPGMVRVGEDTCIDQFEASRADATATWSGDDARATSRAGVLPWYPVEYDTARAACQAAGKRLCRRDELRLACQGPAATVYPYGDAYIANACNGIDTFCNCEHANCAFLTQCPYPNCRESSPDGVSGRGCGSDPHVMPTGSYPGCVNSWGAFDLAGNVWELVDVGTRESWYVGGAFNCLDSETLHRCDGLHQDVNARGFRCCAERIDDDE